MTVPLRDAPPAAVADMRARLLDGSAPLADRYRALFALRNISGADAEDSLAAGEKRREEGGAREWRPARMKRQRTCVCNRVGIGEGRGRARARARGPRFAQKPPPPSS